MKKIKYLCIFLSISIILLISCDSKIIQTFNLLENYDSTPPKLKYIESNSPYSIEILFDEALANKTSSSFYLDKLKKTNYKINKNKLTYFQQDELIPGEKHNLVIKVEDLNGNSTQVESEVYTKNTNLAEVLISEVSTKGTSSNCDKVELVVTKSGSIAGIVVSDGFNQNYEDRCILPNILVNEGDFIVISFKDNKNEDYLISENKNGLSSNNGCLLVLDSPSFNAKVLDCIIYSNKTSENCEGFANEKTLEIAKTLSSIGMWENSYPLSNEAIDTTYETSTRTINRRVINNYFFVDTDSKNDFYITVTKGNSFGSINNENEYLID
ncbi:MAG: hypothetical protein ACPKM0_04855 [Pleomorphochaeta sp.]